MPKISVIMSVYNNQDYLRESIESIINQTYKDFEFIITDDCSTDNSVNIIREYTNKDKRIIFVQNKENIGLTKSLNKMIEIASGEYIARMDGDDIAKLNRFEEQIKVFKENRDVDMVFSNVLLIDEKSNYICPSFRPNKLKKIIELMDIINYIPHPTIMIKKDVLDNKGRYNPDFRTGQDKELWERLIKKNTNFYYLRKILLFYRIHSNNISKGKNNISREYNLANICIANNFKFKGFKYFTKLTFKEKLIFLIKILIPYKLLSFKGNLFRKWKMNSKGR
ncbi:Glycosyltransferase involved in cell wall bisynthesis [Orenia metallireducens]|uniref:Glycosyltransferase involved in cell wall bisynthesis n=1 Tax=Orenia metallireducens TaxID=1413210 RepID=A0A285FWV7_9FIRM|nr:glycosyltransferase [Orenia metallireducens]SNY15304.1 Glycosyltransferase involved in cell wall bisynthesis [Orenia metallireducens]